MSYEDYVVWIREVLKAKRKIGLSLETYYAYKALKTLYLKLDKQLNQFL
jgi:hypothetical protein